MPNYSDPNDPTYSADPENYEWSNGGWNKKNPNIGDYFNAAADKFKGANEKIGGAIGKLNPLGDAGVLPKQLNANAPGASLNTSKADEQRSRLAPLLAQLQSQASTGDGAWQNAFKNATGQANASVQALGQSQPGVGYQSTLRNIGNAQGAVAQRAVGQEDMLRNQAKLDAQSQLSGLTSGIGDQDVNQAGAAAGVKQGVREANLSLVQGAKKEAKGIMSSLGGLLGGLSEGGTVPGEPEVFGDDEKNDTVPAWLSPGEIVIPRSHAGSPEQAADFVRALRESKGARHFDAGGEVGDGTGLRDTSLDEAGIGVGTFFDPTQNMNPMGLLNDAYGKLGDAPQAPSVQNGGLLNTGNYDENRAATLQNQNAMMANAKGAGPSNVGQQMQNSSDANIAAAMAAGAGRRGSAGAGDMLQGVGAAQQGAAGKAGAAKAGEQASGQAALMRAVLGQRARDMALAQSQQQAAFRNTQMNAGIALDQQNQLRSLLSGAGQAISAHSAASPGGGGGAERDVGHGSRQSEIDDAFNAPDSFDAGAGDYGPSDGGGYDIGGDEGGSYAAHGGQVVKDTRARDFVAALRRRKSA